MSQSFSRRVHFYYCILVALRMYGKKQPGNARGKNNFLLKWLRNAENGNLFPPEISSEITWLRGKIISAGPDADLEPMLVYVYQTARRAEGMKDH